MRSPSTQPPRVRAVTLLTAACVMAATGCSDDTWTTADRGVVDGDARVARDLARADRRPDSGPPPPSIKVHTVDVGVGLCMVVEMPDPTQPVLLFDCGRHAFKSADVPFQAGVNQVAAIVGKRSVALVLSHPDADHYTLVDNVLESPSGVVPLTTVWIGGKLDDYDANSGRVFARLKPFFAANPQKAHQGMPNTYHSPYPAGEPDLTFGKVKAYVLAVNASQSLPRPDTNGLSLVLALNYGSFWAVLTGDATGLAQDRAVKNAATMGLPLGQTLFLSAAHHGAKTDGSNNDVWARAVRPQVVTYSAGGRDKGGRFTLYNGHPTREVVQRFETLSSVRQAGGHRLWQGDTTDSSSSITSTRAHFLTAANGVITVASNGRAGDLRVSCKAIGGVARDTNCSIK